MSGLNSYMTAGLRTARPAGVVEQIEHDHHGCRRPVQAGRHRLALAKIGTAGNAHIENTGWLLILVRP